MLEVYETHLDVRTAYMPVVTRDKANPNRSSVRLNVIEHTK